MGHSIFALLARMPLDLVRVDVAALAARDDPDRALLVLAAIVRTTTRLRPDRIAGGIGTPEIRDGRRRRRGRDCVHGRGQPHDLTVDRRRRRWSPSRPSDRPSVIAPARCSADRRAATRWPTRGLGPAVRGACPGGNPWECLRRATARGEPGAALPGPLDRPRRAGRAHRAHRSRCSLPTVGMLRRVVPPPDPSTWAGVDLVLISHLHGDHLHIPSLRTVGPRVRIVVPRGAGAWLRGRGFPHVDELSAGEGSRTAACASPPSAPSTAGTAGAPGRRTGPTPRRSASCCEGAGSCVYVSGDTGLYDGMPLLGKRTVDVALLPVWGWGPTLGPGHLDPAGAADAAALIRPRIAVPVHWGTLALAGMTAAALAAARPDAPPARRTAARLRRRGRRPRARDPGRRHPARRRGRPLPAGRGMNLDLLAAPLVRGVADRLPGAVRARAARLGRPGRADRRRRRRGRRVRR